MATTFGISTQALKRLNDVEGEAEIHGGTLLVVPRISEEQRLKNRAKARAAASSVTAAPGAPTRRRPTSPPR